MIQNYRKQNKEIAFALFITYYNLRKKHFKRVKPVVLLTGSRSSTKERIAGLTVRINPIRDGKLGCYYTRRKKKPRR